MADLLPELTPDGGEPLPTAPKLIAVDVLRAMLIDRIAASQRGDVSKDYLRGYAVAMFHAGALSEDECRMLLTGESEPFTLDGLPE